MATLRTFGAAATAVDEAVAVQRAAPGGAASLQIWMLAAAAQKSVASQIRGNGTFS